MTGVAAGAGFAVNGGATASCLVCTAPMPAGRSRRDMRCCSRDCTLASVGLPADFDPKSLGVGPMKCHEPRGGWLGYCRELQPDTPEIEAAIKAVLEAAPR